MHFQSFVSATWIYTFSQIANPYVVADHGLGKDMWNVNPDDITYILYVSSRLNILGNFWLIATRYISGTSWFTLRPFLSLKFPLYSSTSAYSAVKASATLPTPWWRQTSPFSSHLKSSLFSNAGLFKARGEHGMVLLKPSAATSICKAGWLLHSALFSTF